MHFMTGETDVFKCLGHCNGTMSIRFSRNGIDEHETGINLTSTQPKETSHAGHILPVV
jgi:hypothetical protein